jgi:Uma2 family endonuclease
MSQPATKRPAPNAAAAPVATAAPVVPPLENGDHLTRPEFERRYAATPWAKKAELIDGVVYMAAAVSTRGHGIPHFRMIALLGQYELATPGIAGADNTSVRFDLDNMPQPDVFLTILPSQSDKVDEDDIFASAPDLICEIAATSASIDLHRKLELYRRKGVKEYVVWQTLEGKLDYFVGREGAYQALPAAPSGEFRSEVFPGLWLDASAILNDDWARAAKTMQQGLASPEHAAFVTRLKP